MHKNIIIFSLVAIAIIAAIFALFLNDKKVIEEKEEAICTEDFKPVCADDGQTYMNTCKALASGSVILREGNCEDKAMLTSDSIENATYRLNEQYIKFSNGKSDQGEIYKYAFGNLDNDDLSDAAVVINTNNNQELIIMLNDDESPIYWTSVSLSSEAIDIKIDDKLIIIDLKKGEELKYRLEGTKLIKK